MLLTWTEFVAFLSAGLQELIETEYAQIRYGDVGMAVSLAAAIGIALFLTVARLAICRPKHTRHHSGHAIDGVDQKNLWVKIAHAAPKTFVAVALAFGREFFARVPQENVEEYETFKKLSFAALNDLNPKRILNRLRAIRIAASEGESPSSRLRSGEGGGDG